MDLRYQALWMLLFSHEYSFHHEFQCLKVILHTFVVNRKSPQVHDYYSQDWKAAEKDAEIILDPNNPMCNLFPTVVSCDWKTVGAGGGDEITNGLCVLSQNIVNQWVWI